MGGDGSGDYDLLDRLAEEFAARYRRGERPSLEEYTDKYPQLAADIREVFPAMAAIEQADEDRRGPDEAAAPPLEVVGDYRILREIGRGGMGVVYEAEQVSLGRRVALKVLRLHGARDGKAVERFKREARAAARLHHTNIVPVFEVGQAGDACFYAMQLIQGQGLDVIVEEVRRLREASLPGGAHPTGTAGEVTLHDPAANTPRTESHGLLAQSLLTGRFRSQDLALPEGRMHGPAGSAGVPPAGPGEPGGRDARALEAAAPVNDPTFGDGFSAGENPISSAPLLPGGTDRSGSQSGRWHFYRSVARIGQQTAAALAHAHARGIVHRDVKPSNLLLDEAGVVWITDFGLAKTEDQDLTQTGDLVGTIRYMAPERFRGECDARTDVYGLGLTLYELLALRPAFEAPDRLQLIDQIKNREPARPRALDPRVPRDLETIVLKAMDKDPRRRYPSADELAEDLRCFLGDEPIKARPVGSVERLWRLCRRNPVVALLASSVALLVVLLAIGSSVAALRLERQTQALLEGVVRSLLTTSPDSVPDHLESLRPLRERALPLLRASLDDPATDSGRRLRAAIALTVLGEPQTAFLLEQLPTAPAAEGGNLMRALAAVKDSARGPLLEQAGREGDAATKARYAATLLQLGEPRAAREMLAPAPDPLFRVTFIRDFPSWRGDLAGMPALLRGAEEPAFRSGLCLALGGVDPGKLGAGEREALAEVLSDLFVRADDGATHSAAGWALRRWKIDPPPLPSSRTAPAGRHWFVNSRGITLLEMEPGVFTMGDASLQNQRPQTVLLPRPFFLGDREVSLGLFRQFLADPDCPAGEKPLDWPGPIPGVSPTDDCPVQNVSWQDAILFCNWLSRAEGRKPCYRRVAGPHAWQCDFEADGYRMPTGAEWEYACRAGTTTLFPYGKDPEFLLSYANLEQIRTIPGGSRLPNGWGLFDLIGNVWDMCWEAGGSPAGSAAIDPGEGRGPPLLIGRGGGFGAGSYYARSAYRLLIPADFRSPDGTWGFRVVCRDRGRGRPVEETLADLERRADAALPPDKHRERVELRLACAQWYAERGRWERAAGAYAKLIEFDPSDPSHRFPSAPLLLQRGDLAGYRRSCRELLAQFGQTSDPAVAAQVALTCLLAPGAVEDYEPVAKLAEQAARATGAAAAADQPWFVLVRALADYRAGRFAAAADRLGKDLASKSATGYRDGTAYLVLALARRRLGQTEEAMQALARARELAAKEFPNPEKGDLLGPDWPHWLRFQVLRSEAESPPPEAPPHPEP
jgi:serine/threonine protein kinase/formylglycine-generating enzyme required for sulfatase activity